MDVRRWLESLVESGQATAEEARQLREQRWEDPEVPTTGRLLKGMVVDPLVAAGELAGGKEVPYLQEDLIRNVGEGYFGLGEPYQESFPMGSLDPRYVEKVADTVMNIEMPGLAKGAANAAAGVMPDMNQVNINPWPTIYGDPNLFKEVPGSHLGGSTGAKLMQHPGLPLDPPVVVKAGGSPGHVNEELIADDLYRAMQFPHPDTYAADIGGVPHRISPFVKGRNYPDLGPIEKNVADQRLRDQFLGDALLANWDVAGGGKWPNIILEPGTLNPLRIDPGGALRYRAQGGLKGAAFEKNAVPELQSMQKYATANMLPEDLEHQYGKFISPNEMAIMQAVQNDPELTDIMGGRLDALRWDYGAGTAGSLPPISQLTPPLPNLSQLPTTQGNNNYLSQYGVPPPPTVNPYAQVPFDYHDWLAQHGVQDTSNNWVDYVNGNPPGTLGANVAAGAPPTQLPPPPAQINVPPSPAPPAKTALPGAGQAVPAGDYASWLTQHGIQDDMDHWMDWANNNPPGTNAASLALATPGTGAAQYTPPTLMTSSPDYSDWLQKHGIADSQEHAEDWANAYHPGTTAIHGGYPPAPEWHDAFAEYNKFIDKLVADGDTSSAATWLVNAAVKDPHNYPSTIASAGVDVKKIQAGLNIGQGDVIQPGPASVGGTPVLATPAIQTAPFKPTGPSKIIKPGGRFDWESDFDVLANWVSKDSGLNPKNPDDWANASDLAWHMIQHPGTFTDKMTKEGINLRGLGQADPGQVEWTVQRREAQAEGRTVPSHPMQDVQTEPGWATHKYRNQNASPLYIGGDEWNQFMNAIYNADINADADIITAIKPSNTEAMKRQAQLNVLDQLPRDWKQSMAYEPYVPHAVKQSDPNWSQNLPPDLQSAMTPERYAKAMAGGFDPGIYYRGAPYAYKRFLDPSGKPGSPYIFQSDAATIAGTYGSKYVYPEALRFGNTEITDVGGRSYGTPYLWLEHMAQGGRQRGLDSMQIKNMYDSGGIQTQYLTANPNQHRSPYAEFDPAKRDDPYLLAAKAGGINPFAGQQEEEEPLFPWLPKPASQPARARPRA